MDSASLQSAWARVRLRRDIEHRALKAQCARPFLQSLDWTPEQLAAYDDRIQQIHARAAAWRPDDWEPVHT